MNPTLTIALRAAKAAADKLAYVTNNLDVLTAEGDSHSFVVEQSLDDAAFRVKKILSNAYDGVKIFNAHESNNPTAEDKEYWYVNVLSGSNNFAIGFGYFCVIVSQYKLGKIENTVIVNPMTDEIYTASRGRGAQYNEKKIRIKQKREVHDCAIANFAQNGWEKDALFTRITGCSVLDLCHLASGQFDAVFAQVTHPMELQAALLVSSEAGALSGSPQGAPINSTSIEALVSNAKLFKSLIVAKAPVAVIATEEA
ncbi:inositol monophosphatase family protein [Marinicellulosiphila megalodicopiae]|uniref:inositol monophosphatase family protein n=1 Tax=Marinicellulosiphila megalodicopiae TaxID=2724896 RepID=UPI003BAEDFAD